MDKEEAKKNKIKKLLQFSEAPNETTFAQIIDICNSIENLSIGTEKIPQSINNISDKLISSVDKLSEILKEEKEKKWTINLILE